MLARKLEKYYSIFLHLLLITSILFFVPVVFADPVDPTKVHQVQHYNIAIQDFDKQMHAAIPSAQKSKIQTDVILLLKQRDEILQKLIKDDPESAVKLFFKPKTLFPNFDSKFTISLYIGIKKGKKINKFTPIRIDNKLHAVASRETQGLMNTK